MTDWVLNLPLAWMALVVFGGTYLVAAGIYFVVTGLAVNDRARAFKALSPGMLPPLGIIFGLLVGFMAVQVWGDSERAKVAVANEASALRAVVLLAASFPGGPEARLRALINEHIAEAVNQEWPMMAHQRATLTKRSEDLTQALKGALALTPVDDGQKIAQREIVTALEHALDARRQRIIISQFWLDQMGGPDATGVLCLDCRCDGSQRQPAHMRHSPDAVCDRHRAVAAADRRL